MLKWFHRIVYMLDDVMSEENLGLLVIKLFKVINRVGLLVSFLFLSYDFDGC